MRIILILLISFLYSIQGVASPGDTTLVGKSKNGVRHGAWSYYDKTMHLLKVEKYRRGILKQTYIFNSKGQVIERINKKGYVTKLRACGC